MTPPTTPEAIIRSAISESSLKSCFGRAWSIRRAIRSGGTNPTSEETTMKPTVAATSGRWGRK
jgi:hypothetical protein